MGSGTQTCRISPSRILMIANKDMASWSAMLPDRENFYAEKGLAHRGAQRFFKSGLCIYTDRSKTNTGIF